MCGIAGYLGLIDRPLLGAMAARIAHRGPDGDGFWHDDAAQVGLAHRRLAIIDPTDAASQPMASCGDRYQVTFNGEIYNFQELAAELRAAGYVFNPKSDTAVLGPLYDRYGADMLPRLNGIFAFAIWDRKERRLMIARDASGTKPLYYTTTRRSGTGSLLFASEIKALTAFPGLDRTIDTAAIGDYLTNLWSAGDRTPFRAVRKLPPGHMLTARLDHITITKWDNSGDWAVRDRSRAPRNAADLTGQLSQLFDQAVASQCLSDVPIGAFLSGGVDSSAIVASMVASGHRPRQTYCVGFSGGDRLADEGFSDDLQYARQVAAALDVPLTPIEVTPPVAADIEDLVYLLDEPQADPAPLFVAAIAKAARADGIKVLLGGTGGDDIFSGYRRHKAAAARARVGPALGLLTHPTVGRMTGLMSKPLRRRFDKLQYMFDGTDDEFLLRAFEFNPQASALSMLSGDARAGIAGSEPGWLARACAQSQGQPLVDRMLDLELAGFLPDHNLNYTDKASMAHGVEVRVPFLDTRLLAFARTVPWQFKTGLHSEKVILKEAVAARLPAGVLTRKKTGFGAPVRAWIAGPMRAMAEDLFASSSFADRGLFDVAATRRLLADTVAGRQDGAYLVLALMMTELWLRRFATPVNEAAKPCV